VAGHPRVKSLGLGDLQVARCALDLAGMEDAPLRIAGAAGGKDALDGFRAWRLYPAVGAGDGLAGDTKSIGRKPAKQRK
jgi:hypothetical protein